MKLAAADGHPYQVMAAAIAAKIRRGDLATDERLPSLRALAKEYGVTLTTAQRAVQQLVQGGFVRSVPNLGSFVLPADPEAPHPLTLESVHAQIEELARTLAQMDERLRSLENLNETATPKGRGGQTASRAAQPGR